MSDERQCGFRCSDESNNPAGAGWNTVFTYQIEDTGRWKPMSCGGYSPKLKGKLKIEDLVAKDLATPVLCQKLWLEKDGAKIETRIEKCRVPGECADR